MIRKLLENVSSLSPIYKYKIQGSSMSPTLCPGKVILINRLIYTLKAPHIDDIIVVKYPKKDRYIIKRIKKIEEGKYYVLGDNPVHSTDSRHFGWIEKKDIIGKVII